MRTTYVMCVTALVLALLGAPSIARAQSTGAASISGGVSAFPADGTQGPDLIRHADQALYRAKAEGRNQVFAYQAIEFGDTGESRPVPVLAGDDR